jgi:hypothetical protein
LYFLGSQQDDLWKRYLARIEEAGTSRDAPMIAAGGHVHGAGCSH